VAGEPEAQMGGMAAEADGAVEIDWSADDLGLAATPDETDEETEDEGAEGEAEGGAAPSPEMRQTTQEPAADAAPPAQPGLVRYIDRYMRLERRATAGDEEALAAILADKDAARLWGQRQQTVQTEAAAGADVLAQGRQFVGEMDRLRTEDPVRFGALLDDVGVAQRYADWRRYFVQHPGAQTQAGATGGMSAQPAAASSPALDRAYDQLMASEAAALLDDKARDQLAPERYAGQPVETALAQFVSDAAAAVAAASVRREAAPTVQRARAVEGRAETVRAAIAASPPPLPASQAPVRKTPRQVLDDWQNNPNPQTRAAYEAVRNRLFSRG
jgi:hypothetical protein